MIPKVVMVVFLISLAECLFILPAHLGHQKTKKRRGLTGWLSAKQEAFSRWFKQWVERNYGPFLRMTIRHRYLTIATAVTILVMAMSYALSGRMGFGLFPATESNFAQAELVLPYGSSVKKTEAILHRLIESARTIASRPGNEKLVESISTEVGREGSHTGRIRVALADADIRDTIMSTDEFTNRWREEVGEVAGVETLKFAADAGGPGHGYALTIELSHRDIDVLAAASSDLADTIRTYPRVKDVDDGFQPGKQQLDFSVKAEGKSLGLSARDIARQVRNAFYGAEVLRQQRGRNEIKVMVRLPENERSSEQTINDMMIRTADNCYVPLREVAAIKRGRAYTSINRRNGRRVIQVQADVTPRSKAGRDSGRHRGIGDAAAGE